MDEGDWNSGFARSLMVFLNGDAIPELDHMGRRISDDHFLLLFNAHSGADQLHPAGEGVRQQLGGPAGHRHRGGGPGRGQALASPVQALRSRPTRWWCCPPRWCREAERAASEQRAEKAMASTAKESATTG